MCTVPKMVLGTKKHLSDSIFSRITWVSLRDVNSREITFPGRETQLLGLDRDSRFHPSTFYQRDRSWISSGGAKGGAAIAGRSPTLFPADARPPSPPANDRRSRRWRSPTQNGETKIDDGFTRYTELVLILLMDHKIWLKLEPNQFWLRQMDHV